jgi:hypothetical protein
MEATGNKGIYQIAKNEYFTGSPACSSNTRMPIFKQALIPGC